MNETLIANYNSKVSPKDTVYHLGDFGYRTDIASRLNGTKYLIIGNHDWPVIKKLEPYFEWVKDTHQLRLHNKRKIWLAHYPHRAWPSAYRGSYHFFGHVHGRLPDAGRSCDVGVDAWNYFPVHLNELITRLEKNWTPPVDNRSTDEDL